MSALAFSGLGVEVCGVEPDPAGARVYIGPRYDGRYFLARGDDADRCLIAWARSTRKHLLMDHRDVPYLLTEYRHAR
jgi:hypothetical protein